MVPKVAGKGRSFKGAGLYYLHDKGAMTSDRVAFTLTLNLPTDDAEKAMGWMAHTALRQAEIKKAAGGVAKGRKLRDPVYTYSLAWAPDEQPSREDMIAAATATIRELGLAEHEAVFVAHNDQPHPHIHVIVNRVNPGNGVAAPLSNDLLKLSRWAEAYEVQQGKIRCEQRVENNKRRRGAFVKDRTHSDAEFYRWRRARLEAAHLKRESDKTALTALQRHDLDALAASRDALIEERRRELKEGNKPAWAALYKKQREEKRAFEDAQKSTFGRLRYWLKNRHIDRWGGSQLDRQGMLSRAFQIVVKGDHMRKALADKHEADRKAFSAALRQEANERAGIVKAAYEKMLARVQEQHRAERDAQRAAHSRQSQDEARRIAKGSDRTAFAFGQQAGKDEPPAPTAPFNEAASSVEALRGTAADAFREAAKDESGEDRAADKEQERGDDGAAARPVEEGEAARMIRAAREAQADEDKGRQDGEGKPRKAFSAFRDARDGEGQDRGGRGRERSRKPPGGGGGGGPGQ